MGSGRWVQADGFRPLDLDGMADPFYAPELSETFPYPYEYINCIDLGAAPWCRIYSEKQYTNINRKEACFL